jgi:uncharacterized repeat protein (TIGR01451 family)
MQWRNAAALAAMGLLVACGGGTTTPDPASDVVLVATGSSADITAGGDAVLHFTLTNRGPDTANNVVTTLRIPSGLTPTSVSCSATGGGVCPDTIGPTTIVPKLPVGASVDLGVAVTVAANSPGTYVSSAQILGVNDPTPADGVSSFTLTAHAPPHVTSVHLQSDSGDFIGRGLTYDYSRTNAILSITATGRRASVKVTGDENWNGDFELPGTGTQLAPGTYTNLTRWPFNTAPAGGLSWSGEGRGCNTLTGSITIAAVTYANGVLQSLDMSFEQHCEGGTAALRGQIHYDALDTSTPPGPVNPPTATLWAPPAGSTPASGNYVFLQSDPGDYIGAGGTSLTVPPTTITVTGNGGRVSVSANGWVGDFQAMTGLALMQPGYYGGLQRYPFHNPALGGLDWYGQGRGCNTLTGWFVVDSVTYVGVTLKAIDLRFEQHCEGGAAALHGAIHWVAP